LGCPVNPLSQNVKRTTRALRRFADYRAALNELAGDIPDHLLRAGSFADERRLVHCLTLAGKGAFEAAAFEEAKRSFRSALSRDSGIFSER
jgi:hypothetical protein